jgi:hypothetical protein
VSRQARKEVELGRPKADEIGSSQIGLYLSRPFAFTRLPEAEDIMPNRALEILVVDIVAENKGPAG